MVLINQNISVHTSFQTKKEIAGWSKYCVKLKKRNVISKIYPKKYVWPVFLKNKLTSRRWSDFDLLSRENIIYGQDPFILLSLQMQIYQDPDVRFRNTQISTEFWGVSKNDTCWPHFIRKEKSSPVDGPYVETLSEMNTKSFNNFIYVITETTCFINYRFYCLWWFKSILMMRAIVT